ncbi:MAG TPA: amidohydrolase family protein, partial [Planctomycetia bacterium]|nr:amidohydrolase family protein [Planctomycetia bacterium]
IDLASRSAEAQIAEFRAHPKFVGVRHIVQDEPDDDFIVRPAFLRGLGLLEQAGLPYDLLFFVKHLRHAATVAEKFPRLKLVIDHLAKPRIKNGSTEDWAPDFRRAAACPNVFCKLSGMTTEADWATWKPADLQPYVNAALELFGPERLMYGSDWPVCELAATYERQYTALLECLGKLSPAEEAAIFGGTARAFYAV